jgi:hypothetical protein
MKTYLLAAIAALAIAMPAAADWNAPTQWSAVIADYLTKGYDDRSNDGWNVWVSKQNNSLWSNPGEPFGFNCRFGKRPPELNCQKYDMRNGGYVGRVYWSPPFYPWE